MSTPAPGSLIQQESAGNRVSTTTTIHHHAAPGIHMYRLSRDQLESIASFWDSLSFGVFTLLAGLCAAFWIVVATVDLTDRSHATFIALAFSSGALAGFFLIVTCVVGWRKWKRLREVFASEIEATVEH
jgi:hypothetical protein